MATSALHITLGVFLKIFKLLEETCKQLDYQLSHYLLKKHYDLHSMSQQIEGIFRLHDYIRRLEDGVNKCTEHYNWKMPQHGDNDVERHKLQDLYNNHINRLEEEQQKKVYIIS